MAPPVRRIMRAGVISIPEDAPLAQARQALIQHTVHAVLVVAAGHGRPIGWVTAAGLLPYVGEDAIGLHAGLAITESPAFIAPEASVLEAARKLCEAGVSRLLVTRGAAATTPLGVVTDLDVLRASI